jgi:uncharacterized membrane protein YheB (UPF0754 family)
MGYLRFLVYPLLGAFVGYITNYIAIKLLFWPRRRVLGVQGLLPKRKAEIAKRAGEVVNGYLVNSEAIRLKIDIHKLDGAIDRFLGRRKTRLWDIPFLKKIVKKIILSNLLDKDGYFNKAIIESFIDERMVSGIVEQKINEFELSELEKLAYTASGPELRFIVISGGVLGFLVGLAESFIRLPHY